MLTPKGRMPATKIADLTLENLTEGFGSLGIESGDTLFVQCSYMALRKVVGGPQAVIEALLKTLGPEGTLIMPTFNWQDFGENKLYSKRHTKVQTGVLTQLLADREDSYRIYHPIHGFSLVGKNARSLTEKIHNKSSFEESSLFGEMRRMNAKIMLLGVNYRQGFTFFHYVEESVGVPYRKYIQLSGKIEELDGTQRDIEIPYYGRNSLSLRYDLDLIEPILESEGSTRVQIKKIGLATVKVMRAQEAYDCLKVALEENPNLVLIDS